MSNTISIEVNSLLLVLEKYNQIKVYKSATISGTYTEVTNSSTRINLNNQDTLYPYTDSSGISTDYYKTSYFHSSTMQESTLSGAVSALVITNQLSENMQVIITLSESIKDINGHSLGGTLSYYFTTTYNPLYSSVRKLRLEVGSFIADLPDDTLNLAIFEASLMANGINWVKGSTSDFFRFARREWVTCKAAEILLDNVFALLGGTSKKLDNLEIKYDAKAGQNLLDKIKACLAKWEAEVVSGGNATQRPQMVVKGSWDPDAPHVGRLWEKGPRTHHDPGANLRYRPFGHRRFINGWLGNRRSRF